MNPGTRPVSARGPAPPKRRESPVPSVDVWTAGDNPSPRISAGPATLLSRAGHAGRAERISAEAAAVLSASSSGHTAERLRTGLEGLVAALRESHRVGFLNADLRARDADGGGTIGQVRAKGRHTFFPEPPVHPSPCSSAGSFWPALDGIIQAYSPLPPLLTAGEPGGDSCPYCRSCTFSKRLCGCLLVRPARRPDRAGARTLRMACDVGKSDTDHAAACLESSLVCFPYMLTERAGLVNRRKASLLWLQPDSLS